MKNNDKIKSFGDVKLTTEISSPLALAVGLVFSGFLGLVDFWLHKSSA